MPEIKSEQQKRIESGLAELLRGEDKHLTLVAALSIAVTTAFLTGITKLEVQKMIMRMYERRESEERAKCLKTQ